MEKFTNNETKMEGKGNLDIDDFMWFWQMSFGAFTKKEYNKDIHRKFEFTNNSLAYAVDILLRKLWT